MGDRADLPPPVEWPDPEAWRLSDRFGEPDLVVPSAPAWHDNSTGNRENPDPRQWVGNGSRTVDEMAHAWVDVTYLEQDEYEQMLAEREELADDD